MARNFRDSSTVSSSTHFISVIGDSHSLAFDMTWPTATWPSVTCKMLRDLQGCNVLEKNLGISGDTTISTSNYGSSGSAITQGMRERISRTYAVYGKPDILIIAGGNNDLFSSNIVNVPTTSTVATNLMTIGLAARNGVYGGTLGYYINGVVASPSLLPSGMPVGCRFMVYSDPNTSAGVPVDGGGTAIPTTVAVGNYKISAPTNGLTTTGTGSAQIWQCANSSPGTSGWYRTYMVDDVPGQAPYIDKIIVQGLHLYPTTESYNSQNASYQSCRYMQQYAVTMLQNIIAVNNPSSTGQVQYLDMYSKQNILLYYVNGLYWSADNSSNNGPSPSGMNNNHYSNVGQAVKAKIYYDFIVNLGWHTSLQ